MDVFTDGDISRLKKRVEDLEESERKARLEAETLARAMWRRWYKEDSPNFELCDSTAGIITQIDNMVAGMKREKEEPLRFADKRLLERALGSLSKGDVEDATRCIEVVLERSPDFN